MKTALKAFFGGGSTYFYLGIAIIVVGMYGYISFLEARLDTVKGQRDTAIAESNSKGAIVNSENRNRQNEEDNKKEAQDAKDNLNDAINPIEYAYDWVRERREQSRNSDE